MSLYTVNESALNTFADWTKQDAVMALESGKIVYFPAYFFQIEAHEQSILSESLLVDTTRKNISYDYMLKKITGVGPSAAALQLQTMMHRFAQFTEMLVTTLIPQYRQTLRWGRTSYRPAEIKGRACSKRQDDTRVHVDSFASTPVNGMRILRVFCNINPYGEPRVWHVGESFSNVLLKFASQIPPYSVLRARMLKWARITKTLRSHYDHKMLHLHDKMKLDDNYQQSLAKKRIDFPSQSTWIVFTDHVSHAALSGQFLLEQTFYVPVTSMLNPEQSPKHQWDAHHVYQTNKVK